MLLRFIFSLIFLLIGWSVGAQQANLQGTVYHAETRTPVRDAAVSILKTSRIAVTDAQGMFLLENLPAGNYIMTISAPGFQLLERPIELKSGASAVLDIALKPEQNEVASIVDLPTVTLEEADDQTDGAGEVANLLHASRDIFQTVSGFGWFNFRFRERGYDSEHFPLLLNGVSINDPETGLTFFSEFGGLNDVLRRRESTIGMEANDFSFGGIGGASMIDTRASVQRKTTRFSYANSNRAYNHRFMFTSNTGLLPNGWAFSLSLSTRQGHQLLVPGTFFEGYAYFLSVDRKFKHKHTLNLTFLGSPNWRGRQTDTNPELIELTGNNLYNPSWGYQNGRVRNAAAQLTHQPIAILRYDFTPNRRMALTFSTYGQAGLRADQRIEWADAGNPNPDYYRRWPSFIVDSALRAQHVAFLKSDPNQLQVQWDKFIEANRHNTETIRNVDGVPGKFVTGQRSVYIVEDRRSDSRELGTNIFVRYTLNPRVVLNGGAHYLYYLGKNFKVVNDLLGGDFWLDVNRFAARDFPNNPDAAQSNLATPNRLVKEGDRFGYDYDENIRKSGAWVQAQFSLKRFQFFGAAEFLHTVFWRTGHYQVGLFPDKSLGNSKKFSFPTYTGKAGAVYKINGRNYLYVNGLYGTRAPQFRDVFLAPRSRNSTNPAASSFGIRSLEGGYHWRAPYYRARLTGYLTDFVGEVETYQVFAPTVNEFGSMSINGINRRHIGIEAAIEAKPILHWTFTAAAAIGQYQFTNRPTMNFTADNTDQYLFQQPETVYQKNFYVPRVPQTAAMTGVRYEGKKYWFASLSVNWSAHFWYDFLELRRTNLGVNGIEKGSPVWNQIIEQKKAPSAYTLDFFGGKSWRIKRKYYINLNLGVNNILDNRNIIVSAREVFVNSIRDTIDPRLYNSEVMYGLGRNYYAAVAFRF